MPATRGTNIQGDKKATSPRTIVRDCAGRHTPSGTPRPPSNSNDVQPCCAFHKTTGVTIAQAKIADTYSAGCLSQCRCSGASTMKVANPLAVKIALYLESPANPRPKPTSGQNCQAETSSNGCGKNSRRAAHAATANPKSSGPSGTIHPPAEAKKKGVTFSAKSAISADREPSSLLTN